MSPTNHFRKTTPLVSLDADDRQQNRAPEAERYMKFHLTQEETKRMFDGNKRRKGWPDTLFAAFCNSAVAELPCVLAVEYSHIQTNQRKRTSAPFFSSVSHCKLPNCYSYKFIISQKPGSPKTTVHCEQRRNSEVSRRSHETYWTHRNRQHGGWPAK